MVDTCEIELEKGEVGCFIHQGGRPLALLFRKQTVSCIHLLPGGLLKEELMDGNVRLDITVVVFVNEI